MKTKKLIYITLGAGGLIFALNALLGDLYSAWRNLPYFVIYSFGFSLGNILYFNVIEKYLNWQKEPEKTLIISILGVIPVNAFIYFLLNWFFKVLIQGQDFTAFMRTLNPLEYTLVILFSLVIALFVITKHFLKKIQETQVRAEQLKTQNERIKFDSLKAQLDPHFLFNNLNVLTALIGENPEKAEAFILALSDVYQYVLAQKDQNLVSLKEEIDFAQNYLDLLKMRFEDGLTYHLPGSVDPTAQIPPLSLQLLLENAIKHNKISVDHPLNIILTIEAEQLIVLNNMNPKKNYGGSFKIGLKNLKERYNLLNSQIEILENEENFIVKLPIFK